MAVSSKHFYFNKYQRSGLRGTPYTSTAPIGNLDNYATNLVAGYSVSRRLLTSYSGNLIRVRRSGDNAESDFGFDSNGELNNSSVQSFCIAGGGTQHGYITTIYDQSGVAGNVVQATAASQPQIVTSGTINTINDKPVAKFDGVDDTLNVLYSGADNFSVYMTARLNSASYYPMLLVLKNSNIELRGFDTSGRPQIASGGAGIIRATSSVGTYGQYTINQLYPGTLSAWLDDTSFGTPVTSASAIIDRINIGSRNGAYESDMNFGELFLYSTSHGTTDREAIQLIQKEYSGTL